MGVPVTYNLRNLAERKGTTLMTAVGIGLTVAVLVMAMALTAGLNTVFAGSGDPRHLVVLRKGVDAELTSSVSGEAYQIIRRLPGIAKTPDGEPMVSPEGIAVVNLPSVEAPEGMNVTVRGMLPVGITMRQLQVVDGQMFKPGLRQVCVGESVARRYPDARIGKKVKFGRGEWEVVGVFKAGESAANSEIWTDLNQLRGDFEQQSGSSSVLVRMDLPLEEAIEQTAAAERTAAQARAKRAAAVKAGAKEADLPAVEDPLLPALAAFRQALADDQRLGVSAMGEKNYYAKQTASGGPLQGLGFSVAIIMAVGSAFAATNTMYAAVARRAKEIGTLRALGFGRWAILRSFMLESVTLSLLGGVVGVLLALPANGFTTGVGNFSTFSETAFKFRIGTGAIVTGLIFAAIIGLVGGFLPAWAAARKNVIAAMREA